jgi:hypothetical protein
MVIPSFRSYSLLWGMTSHNPHVHTERKRLSPNPMLEPEAACARLFRAAS